MFFATEEINENPYLLPNMTLMFIISVGHIQYTLGFLDSLHSQPNNSVYFTNYVCADYKLCDVELTGPTWKTSAKLAFHSWSPKVRMCDPE